MNSCIDPQLKDKIVSSLRLHSQHISQNVDPTKASVLNQRVHEIMLMVNGIPDCGINPLQQFTSPRDQAMGQRMGERWGYAMSHYKPTPEQIVQQTVSYDKFAKGHYDDPDVARRASQSYFYGMAHRYYPETMGKEIEDTPFAPFMKRIPPNQR